MIDLVAIEIAKGDGFSKFEALSKSVQKTYRRHAKYALMGVIGALHARRQDLAADTLLSECKVVDPTFNYINPLEGFDCSAPSEKRDDG